MTDRPLTPTVIVTIGGQTRIYLAFVTTAPPALDSPETITLHAATFADVAALAAEMTVLDNTCGPDAARLILVDATELTWQQARYREQRHLLLPADPGLVGLQTLQQWLWRRIKAHEVVVRCSPCSTH